MGAAFGNIIKNSNISEVIPNFINIQESNIIYLCAMSYILSFILKTSQGSSTSSMIIVSSIIFPIISYINFNINRNHRLYSIHCRILNFKLNLKVREKRE